jgi:hypothetical protein
MFDKNVFTYNGLLDLFKFLNNFKKLPLMAKLTIQRQFEQKSGFGIGPHSCCAS